MKYNFLSQTCGVYYPCDKPWLYQIFGIRTISDTAPPFKARVPSSLRLFLYIPHHYFYNQNLIKNEICRKIEFRKRGKHTYEP